MARRKGKRRKSWTPDKREGERLAAAGHSPIHIRLLLGRGFLGMPHKATQGHRDALSGTVALGATRPGNGLKGPTHGTRGP